VLDFLPAFRATARPAILAGALLNCCSLRSGCDAGDWLPASLNPQVSWSYNSTHEPQHSLLDCALAPGFALAVAGPVSIPSRTLRAEHQSAPLAPQSAAS
jgi:hypothetical protein